MQLTEDVVHKVIKALERPQRSLGDPTLRALLFKQDAAKNRTILRWGMWAAVVSFIAYGVFDWFLLPDLAHELIVLRFTLGIVFLGWLEFGIRKNFSLATLHVIAALAIVSGAVGWLLVAKHTQYQQELSHFIVFGAVFVLGANLFFNFRFAISIISSSIVTIFFVAVIMASLESGLMNRVVLATFFVNCLVFSLYLSWRLGVEHYTTFLHSLRAKSNEQAAIKKGNAMVEIAHTDSLTGLKNRRALMREFSDMNSEWTKDGELGLILIDVDYFKRFNDNLGHQAGDDCLIRLAEAFTLAAATHDAVVGRYGGEEFVVLCHVNGKDHLRLIAEDFCRSVERLHIRHPDRGDNRNIVTISAGATLTRPERKLDFRLLMQEADKALYTSKFAGRASVTVFDPLVVDLDNATGNLPDLLKLAVAKRLTSVAYQPIVEVGSGQILGYEALMRLRDFDGRSISPSVFIPVAEENGAIVELGLWIIEQACRDMAKQGLGTIVTVNVSAIQLRAPNFSLRVAEIINRYELAPQKLALEITERIDIFPDVHAVNNIERLREFGVQIWLDDFGSGYAGLGWLRHFRFDVVKIERGFLNDCSTPEGTRLLHGMIKLLQTLGHTVLVEGVETEEQVQLLRNLGTDLIQGFHFGRPMVIREIAQGRNSLVA